MRGELQLPGFSGIQTIERRRKPPQPHPDKVLPLTNETVKRLMAADLNLKTRGEIARWLSRIQGKFGFRIGEVLPEKHLQLFRLYFRQNEDGRWSTQEEVSLIINGDQEIGWIKPAVSWGIVRIWRRVQIGPRAIEIMKPDYLFYRHLLEHGIWLIDDLHDLKDRPIDLAIVCQHRNGFNRVRDFMQKHFSDWNPKVVFRSEIPDANLAEEFCESTVERAEEMRRAVRP